MGWNYLASRNYIAARACSGVTESAMDLTDTLGDISTEDEEPPDFGDWDDPKEAMRSGPIRERMLDVVVQLREPTKVSTVAERADCDTETARDYLEWFAEMEMVREISGRPVRYERNDSYFRWRRVEQIRNTYSESEIVEALSEIVERMEDLRTKFDADQPEHVSLREIGSELSVEKAWELLSEWKTLEEQAALLDAARQVDPTTDNRPTSVDA